MRKVIGENEMFLTEKSNGNGSPPTRASSEIVDVDLPDMDFMHLAPGSDLIDAGVNIGMFFGGSFPDLGCFETGTTGLQDFRLSTKVLCYPNPLNEKDCFSKTSERQIIKYSYI